eukprot:gene13568-19440_t
MPLWGGDSLILDVSAKALGGTRARVTLLGTRARVTPLGTRARVTPLGTRARVTPLGTRARVTPLGTEAEELLRKCLEDRIGLTSDPKMDTLPEDIGAPQGVEARRVGNNDKRVPLRGELALHATKKLEPGFVVSSYRSGNDWEIMVESYCANDDLLCQRILTVDKRELFIDAVGYGNLAALVNDCTIHPFGLPEKGAAEGLQGEDSDKDEDTYEGRVQEFYDCGGYEGQVGAENAR